MTCTTEKAIHALMGGISAMDEVEAIGMSGNKTPLPKAGESDIDIFIYCNAIPVSEKRKGIINQLGLLAEESKIDVFQGGHWGNGDFVLINGVETWLMYFTTNETLDNMKDILGGKYPDKLDNYYYPIGRCAMLKNINILYDRNGFLASVKKDLSEYPLLLSRTLIQYHVDKLKDTEDLERAVFRKDVPFYHFALDIAMDHFLQALFAINTTYFPSRKRNLNFIENFTTKPKDCGSRLLEVIRLGSRPASIGQSYKLWSAMVTDLQECAYRA